ncbi:hypothetical protein HMPREF0204_14815 [Chryseobacterium gleum ATCC 35910]|uniref:Uncharacterized protein n=1 Tax=Chryseobacterium gleum ATCC 35910 TaxID=525257 RepID=A0ABN0ARR6_CHRGE|nr:hypothetical protein HMPREF0204_14815 [Chryseobacterium gleum ATCC 35910]
MSKIRYPSFQKPAVTAFRNENGDQKFTFDLVLICFDIKIIIN